MFINTNIAAINAQRNLSLTSAKMDKALEQLSSGLRINRAADDAAGLAISEKMRSQIRGMKQGMRNAQDGVSMIQTAEGALDEVHAILQRMRELTVQAGSTILSASDRNAVGEELLTLRQEVDNIAARTRFNGLDLLDGSLSVTAAGTLQGLVTADAGVSVTTTVDANGSDPADTFTVAGAGAVITITNATKNITQAITVVNMAGASLTESQVLDFDALGVKLTLDVTATGAGPFLATAYATDANAKTLLTAGTGSATFRVGADVGDDVTVAFSDLRSTNLGDAGNGFLSALVATNNSVGTVADADKVLGSVDQAIGEVSTQRAKLGAAQNQMESAINSVGVSVENLVASESRIRDADIAMVSSELVTRQIMQQAGIAVLAQANAAPQAALALIG
jgi:flagellin